MEVFDHRVGCNLVTVGWYEVVMEEGSEEEVTNVDVDGFLCCIEIGEGVMVIVGVAKTDVLFVKDSEMFV